MSEDAIHSVFGALENAAIVFVTLNESGPDEGPDMPMRGK
jgi:hypothetical protein